jgi:hypothetical protein
MSTRRHGIVAPSGLLSRAAATSPTAVSAAGAGPDLKSSAPHQLARQRHLRSRDGLERNRALGQLALARPPLRALGFTIDGLR